MKKFYKTWPPELVKVIVDLYNIKAMTPKEIQAYLKINYDLNFTLTSVGTQLYRLRKKGVIRGYINPQLKKISETITKLPKEEADILSSLKSSPLSIGELSRRLDRSKETVIKLLDNLRNKGYEVNIDKAEKRAKLEREISKGFKPLKLPLYRNKVKIGIVSDTHLGSKFQQPTISHTIYKELEKEKIDFALHCGDVVEGKNLYPGQENECFLHGADEMRDYTISNYPKTEAFKTYVIGGSHDMSFKKLAGFNIVRAICEERDDLVYRGEESSSFKMRGLNIEMMHPSGGVSYARSYRPQRIAENMLGEIISIIRVKKDTSILPHCLFLGHYHIANHLPAYMGMEVFSVPGLQAQTPYLKRKGLAPVVGYLIVEIFLNDSGNIIRIIPDFRYMNDLIRERDY